MKIGQDDGGKRGLISKMLLLTMMPRVNNQYQHYLLSGLGSITIVIVIDCNRLQLERNRNCNRNQIFQIVA